MAFLAGLFLGLCLLLFADTAATQSLGDVLPIKWSIPIHPLYFCQNLEWGGRNVAQDLAHRKHPVQCLETARRRVASEQKSPIHLREPFSACMECN